MSKQSGPIGSREGHGQIRDRGYGRFFTVQHEVKHFLLSLMMGITAVLSLPGAGGPVHDAGSGQSGAGRLGAPTVSVGPSWNGFRVVRIEDGTIEDCSRALQLNDLASDAHRYLYHVLLESECQECEEIGGRALHTTLRSESRSAQTLGLGDW